MKYFHFLRNVCRGLSLGAAIRILLVEVVRKIFLSGNSISYAQYGEDRIIDGLIALEKVLPRENGFYVDVGANDPLRRTNTLRLYLRGYRGIAIDANPAMTQQYRVVRNCDTVITALVSSVPGTMHFLIAQNSLVSGVCGVEGDQSEGEVVEMEARRLDDILTDANAPAKIDLLAIDCEGHELHVLESIDLRKWEVSLILVESHCTSVEEHLNTELHRYVVRFPYKLRAFDLMNAYYVREEG